MFAEQLAATPKLSVVVLSSADRAILRARLQPLVPLCLDYRIELLLVRTSEAEADDLAAEFPSVRLVVGSGGDAGIRALRLRGFAEASGDIVIFTDDGDPGAYQRLSALIGTYGLTPENAEQDDRKVVAGAAAEELERPQHIARTPAFGPSLRESSSVGDLLK